MQHYGIMRRAILALVLFPAIAGCTSTASHRSADGRQYLPSDWMSVPESAWQFRALPASIQEVLVETRAEMRREQAEPYFRFYGRYTEGLEGRIATAREAATEGFLVSPTMVNRRLTPELYDTSETPSEFEAGVAMDSNQNMRGARDDWARFWLLDRPSKLSPYPIMSTSGNP